MLQKKKREPDKHGFDESDMHKDDENNLKDDKFADYDEMENDVDDYVNPAEPKD